MPWHTSNLLQQREAFVQLAEAGGQYFSDLCRSFGISRQTGYKWFARHRESAGAPESLADQSRRPHHRARSFGEDVHQKVLLLRTQTGWGAQKLALMLRANGIGIGHTAVNQILKRNGLTRQDSDPPKWITQALVADDPLQIILADAPGAWLPDGFAERLRQGSLRDRKKLIAVLARLKGIRMRTLIECLSLTHNTICRYMEAYQTSGLTGLLPERKSRINDDQHRDAVFQLLHSPPSAFGINRTTWIMVDLQRVLSESGHRLSERRIRRIVRAAGFRWRKARIVLTSRDPEYETKLAAVKAILTDLKSDEAFFSIDEYGPFAVKQKPGRKRVSPGDEYIVPQRQKSKGWMILTAALELSRNQVTHFYSRQKNTDEMIKMADLLRSQYHQYSTIYLSWDAASWHVSKKLMTHIQEINDRASRNGFPIVKTAPLPAGAQFLNVIESVFSGMSRAVIHNSDYPSVEAAKEAIDRYFRDRNVHFVANPKRAGSKIWGRERVPSAFSESQNCKDPAYS
jgi:transposase